MPAAAPYVIFCGFPLSGLPDAEEAARVEITRTGDGLSKCATNAKDIEPVRKAAELLRYAPFAVPREEAPHIAVTFVTRGGEKISLRAGLSSVQYNGRTRALRRKKTFRKRDRGNILQRTAAAGRNRMKKRTMTASVKTAALLIAGAALYASFRGLPPPCLRNARWRTSFGISNTAAGSCAARPPAGNSSKRQKSYSADDSAASAHTGRGGIFNARLCSGAAVF